MTEFVTLTRLPLCCWLLMTLNDCRCAMCNCVFVNCFFLRNRYESPHPPCTHTLLTWLSSSAATLHCIQTSKLCLKQWLFCSQLIPLSHVLFPFIVLSHWKGKLRNTVFHCQLGAWASSHASTRWRDFVSAGPKMSVEEVEEVTVAMEVWVPDY